MRFFLGSDVEAVAGKIARRARVNILLGEQDGSGHALEEIVIWAAPRKRRNEYTSTIRGAGVPLSETPETDDPQGDAILDRWKYVRVILRAQGGEAELTRLSNRFINACDRELGSLDDRGNAGSWRILTDSDGGGDDPSEGVAEEHFVLGLRFHVTREEFTPSANFKVLLPTDIDATGQILVNGPTNAEPEEPVIP